MKKKNILFLCTTVLFFFASCSVEKSAVTNNISVLPDNARYTMINYFKDYHVNYIIKDKGYTVDMYSDIRIHFNKEGEWTSVESRDIPVPSDIIPYIIVSYIKENLSGDYIVVIKKTKGKSYVVELNNGLRMKFDKKGNFVKSVDI
jgi:hypothetical protein